jgi:hypothetical protein
MGLRVEWQAFGCESAPAPLSSSDPPGSFMQEAQKLFDGLKLL